MLKVLIVGSGIVDLAIGKGLVKRGHKVTYVDTDNLKLESLKQQGLQAMIYHEIRKSDFRRHQEECLASMVIYLKKCRIVLSAVGVFLENITRLEQYKKYFGAGS